MDRVRHLELLQQDSAALLDAWRADPHAPVTACPGWDRGDLLVHVGGVHAWTRAQLAAGPAERVPFSTIELPSAADAASWFEPGVTAVVDALAAMDLDATWPTWVGPRPGTFLLRRTTHETAIHRRDASAAPLDPDFAVSCIDDLLEIHAATVPARSPGGTECSIHLHATDVEGEWLVHLGPEGVRIEHGHAKGDLAVRGRAGDLLLWGWNRIPADDRFTLFGDLGLLDRWRSVLTV